MSSKLYDYESGLLVPAAARIFIEEMNTIWLMGTHPLLCPEGRVSDADPLFVMPDAHGRMMELWRNRKKADVGPEYGDVFHLHFCAAPNSKEHVVHGFVAEDWFSIELPNAAADAVLVGEPKQRTLVEHLRWSFQWGGFPGWERRIDQPEKEPALLREGLLPL